MWQVLGWSAIAAIAAAFPIQIPRSKHSIATGDIVIFLLLALHGAAAAVLGSCALEALIASSRTSLRVQQPRSRSLRAAALGDGRSAARCSSMAAAAGCRHHGLPHGCRPPGRRWPLAALRALRGQHDGADAGRSALKRGMRLTLRGLVRQHAAGSARCTWSRRCWPACCRSTRSSSAARRRRWACSSSACRWRCCAPISASSIAEARGAGGRASPPPNAEARAEPEALPLGVHAGLDRHGHRVARRHGPAGQPGAATRCWATTSPSCCGEPFADLLHARRRRAAGPPRRWRAWPRDEDASSIELRCLGADQRETWVSLHCALFDDHGAHRRRADLPAARHHARGAAPRASCATSPTTTRLTDLANRNCFQERLSVAVERSRIDAALQLRGDVCSTSTASRSSTTASAIRPATSC